MLSLEQALLSLKATDTVTILGEAYKVKNVVSATDGKILKARLNLIKPDLVDYCVTIEISSQIFEGPNLHLF